MLIPNLKSKFTQHVRISSYKVCIEFNEISKNYTMYFFITSNSDVQCNLDYSDSLGPNKTVRISYSPDKRGRFIHSGIGMAYGTCVHVRIIEKSG